MPHLHAGLLFVGSICLAVSILLTIEILLIRPANRADHDAGAQTHRSEPAPGLPAGWAAPPHLIYTKAANPGEIGAHPVRPC